MAKAREPKVFRSMDDLPLMLTPYDLMDFLGKGQRQTYELIHSEGFPYVQDGPKIMMKIGQYTGEGMAIGIEKMVGQVQSASEQLANGITAPVTYNSGNSPVQEVQSTLSDVPALAGNIPVSPTGSSKAETLKKEIKLVIEKIILNDTGDKDKKQLVKELLEELIEELKGADEVISSADLGVLL